MIVSFREAFFVLAALLVLIGAAAALALRPPWWPPDGYNYAIRTQVFHGESFGQARSKAQAFYANTEFGRNPRYARLFRGTGKPQYWNLFAVRLLYPALASLFWDRAGFYSLIDVSLGAFVLCGLMIYGLCRQFGPPFLALAGTLAFVAFPKTWLYAHAALTDMLATAFVALTLLALCRWIATGKRSAFVVFCIACGALTATRPIPYIVLSAALLAGFAAALSGRRRLARSAGIAAAVAAVYCVAIVIALRVLRAPGLEWMLHDQQATWQRLYHVPIGALGPWYVHALAITLRSYGGYLLVMLIPLLAIYGIVRRWREPVVAVLAGAWLASLISAAFNPVPSEVIRTENLPALPALIPAAVLGVSLAYERFLQDSSKHPPQLPPHRPNVERGEVNRPAATATKARAP